MGSGISIFGGIRISHDLWDQGSMFFVGKGNRIFAFGSGSQTQEIFGIRDQNRTKIWDQGPQVKKHVT